MEVTKSFSTKQPASPQCQKCEFLEINIVSLEIWPPQLPDVSIIENLLIGSEEGSLAEKPQNLHERLYFSQEDPPKYQNSMCKNFEWIPSGNSFVLQSAEILSYYRTTDN